MANSLTSNDIKEEEEESTLKESSDLLMQLDLQLETPNYSGENFETASVLSKESSDSKSRTSFDQRQAHFRRETRSKSSGSVLRQISLKGIASQLINAHQGEQHGSVSALAINQECTKLLAGFAKGHLCLFDLSNGKLLQNIPDAHTPFTAVLHVKWTDSPGLALISDSGGSVFEMSIRRTMGMNSNESRCIFSGSRGEVCTIEPLIMGHFLSLPPVIDTLIVAMATISKLTHSNQNQLTFIPLQRMKVSYTLQALSWLNSRTLAIIDINETLHVIDVKSQEELDKVDLGRLGLVYASSHFKAIATGGNVSRAMEVGGDRACYHSMFTYGTQILLLGTKSFQVVTMRTWLERVDHLVKNNCLKEALYWLLDIVEDKAQTVIGLTHKKPKKYERAMLERPERGNLVQLLNFYENVVPCCVKVCVGADFNDILFGKLWDTFSEDQVSRDVFVESLVLYILNDQMVDLSPTITQCLLTHYEDKRNFEAAEACIVHLSISSLDIHQTLTLCWSHGLYDAIFYVYTRGMHDYITPLEELLMILRSALDSDSFLSSMQVCLGNKILVYVSCCLAGRAYPHGNIEEEEMKKVKHEVFKCITSLHTKNANTEQEQAFPFLRTLLRFDTREFLNVLAIAFEEEEFTSELGLIQRQRVVDILMQVMVDSEDFDQSQVCSLFIFIARQISKQTGVAISQGLISQVLNELTCVESDAYHEERQSAFMELMHCKSFKGFDFEELTQMAEKARFYRVCEHIYEETGNYEKILECYLNDKFRRLQVFSYINSVMTSPHSHSGTQRYCSKADLVTYSIELAKHLLNIPCLFPLIEQIAEKLKDEDLLIYDYLQALFASRSNFSTRTSVSKRKSNNVSKTEEPSYDSILFPELQDAYIKLMCKLQPNQVYSYLQSAEGYRIDVVLEYCKDTELNEASAFLLEKSGDLQGAFSIHIKILKQKINLVMKIVKVSENGSIGANESVRQKFWFPLLDHLLELQTSIGNQNGLSADMVERYSYEETLFSTVIRVIQGDQLRYLSQMKAQAASPLPISSSSCSLCRSYYRLSSRAVGFRILKGKPSVITSVECLLTMIPTPLVGVCLTHCRDCLSFNVKETLKEFTSGYHSTNILCGHSYHEECGDGDDGSSCVVCAGPSTSRKETKNNKLAQTTQSTELKMDETQLDGLKKVSILDTNIPRLSMFENLKPLRRITSNSPQHDETFSQDFILKLAPKNVIPNVEDA
ncbi:Vacuolar protein sorting-associated protein 8-like protein [Armadillidium nasatum]|uniref:Vacuolar protein sorting-associated protein 8-like protein n=1 Tax=Armadillidium nasatum TaxID=96803 RepID=A0A5N5TMF7_9CRUS|nr:Vacuolar protein sorting-associated protein 8-like protein [Armadillidium nasatum]